MPFAIWQEPGALVHVAEGLPAVADRLLVVPTFRAAVPVPHDLAVMIDCEQAGREASPPAGILDSQIVETPAPGAERSFDGGKKIVGRKRHVAVDTDGRLLMVNLTLAGVSDSAGAQMILAAIRKRWPWVKHLFADSAYDRGKLMDKAEYIEFVIEVIRRMEGQQDFEVLPRR